MKVLVAVKRVVDYRVNVRLNSSSSGVETKHLKMSMNPFDEIALEESIRLKEKGLAEEVIVVSFGEKACEETLQAALAMGADRAILVKTDVLLESLSVAKLLKALVELESPELVMLGKQAIDSDAGQTGQMLAALLDWPQATFASNLAFRDQEIEVTQEVDAGLQTIAVSLPAVITTDLRLNEPRYTSLPNIIKAKSKPLRVLTPEELGVSVEDHLQVVSVSLPPDRPPGLKVKNINELFDTLKANNGVFL